MSKQLLIDTLPFDYKPVPINESLGEDYKAQNAAYHEASKHHAKRLVAAISAMEPHYDSKYHSRQLEDLADQMENQLESQKEREKLNVVGN